MDESKYNGKIFVTAYCAAMELLEEMKEMQLCKVVLNVGVSF